ncbi:hypothetical protein C8Q80DRAFT_1166873 [Daedaleopsis nitida]|nr:hypothetical protein C8Q80DRAFT_1166873 [Daedaleopsis nitida]
MDDEENTALAQRPAVNSHMHQIIRILTTVSKTIVLVGSTIALGLPAASMLRGIFH